MSGCCILGCYNSHRKGFSMRRFPSNVKQQTLWLKNIQRENWQPSQHSRICEVHFSEDMWGKPCVDGTRKLKCNAIPTIFPTQCTLIRPVAKENSRNMDHRQDPSETFNLENTRLTEVSHSETSNLEDTRLTEMRIENQTDTIAATSKSDIQLNLESALLQIKDLERKLKEANEKLVIADTVVRRVEKTNKNLLQRIRKLTSQKRYCVKKSSLKSSEILHQVFNNDQIEWLTNGEYTDGLKRPSKKHFD